MMLSKRSVLPFCLIYPKKYAEFNIQVSPCFHKFFTSYSTYILIFCKFLYINHTLLGILKQLRSVLRCGKVSTGGKRHCLVFLKPDVKKMNQKSC